MSSLHHRPGINYPDKFIYMIKTTRLFTVLPMVFAMSMPTWSAQHKPVQSPLLAGAESTTPANMKHDMNAVGELAKKLQAMNTVSANFSQSTIDKSGRPKVEKGSMQLKRPNQFRWNITSPFNQEIIAKGGKLWMLDPDFKQVVIKKQNNQSGPTAVQLLSGDASEFLTEYAVTRMNYGPEVVYTLRPHKASDLFEMLEIHFSRNEISAISIVDSLGGKRRVDFTQVDLNQPVDGKLFEPDVKTLEKAGFDIIDESGV
ncbi:outer membrane lipoprotein chaperone LolA [Endozoicomonas sp. SCSIO W0465]|uniref:outer membrane lipoprotein chaperone LolA n=1 Tax=Endozoicomonas sp. SCSIO W0465 TaxID=2918516 RepID=UPI002076345E|nr:outer membrane lipoprotein chaperone LolA [Endozoicomonas sp. SCSIO W0465]USE39732.1 outer membrane lipoprotein chaperone LolA [Endozoicomonas sp. SCSIO W0465]